MITIKKLFTALLLMIIVTTPMVTARADVAYDPPFGLRSGAGIWLIIALVAAAVAATVIIIRVKRKK